MEFEEDDRIEPFYENAFLGADEAAVEDNAVSEAADADNTFFPNRVNCCDGDMSRATGIEQIDNMNSIDKISFNLMINPKMYSKILQSMKKETVEKRMVLTTENQKKIQEIIDLCFQEPENVPENVFKAFENFVRLTL